LNLRLYIIDGVQGDRLAGRSLHESLHTRAKAEDNVEGRFLLGGVGVVKIREA